MDGLLGVKALSARTRSFSVCRIIQLVSCTIVSVICIVSLLRPTILPSARSLRQYAFRIETAEARIPEHPKALPKALFTSQTPVSGATPPLPPPDKKEYVAFCMVIKNQSIDMPEFFIHHYHHHGIRRFYIYDDGSIPPLEEHPYIEGYGIPKEAITFVYVKPEDVKDRKQFQVDTYTDCVNRFGNRHKWVAFLDPDEFLEMRGPNAPTLINWLKEWEKNETVGALGVQWLGHNSGGHLAKQPGSIRKAYTTCIENEEGKPNRHVKTFVRPDLFDHIENIHWAVTKADTIEVGEHGDHVQSFNRYPISHDIWALHHYATKSREDYELKKSRHRYVLVMLNMPIV